MKKLTFTNMCPINTIFQFVKNLAPQQKVSLCIPDVLHPKHTELTNLSFHLRNGELKHKAVIKFLGNDFVLYAKKPNERNWFLVTSPSPTILPTPEESTNKRPHRDIDTDSDTEDAHKKARQISEVIVEVRDNLEFRNL